MAEQEAIEEACEIARLPEELLSAALALTTRRDGCRAAAVSRAFRTVADSDAVWTCFLPRGHGLPPLPDGELPPGGKKELYLRLSGSAVLLPGGLVSMWLDRETVAKCYTVSERALSITWGETPQYWSWIPLADSRFSESANLINVCWLDIRGKIHSKMLSQGSAYAVYMVYKLADDSYGLESPVQDAWISVGGTNLLKRKVCLHLDNASGQQGSMTRDRLVPPAEGGVVLPQRRADGWIELSLGEFICEEDEDDDVSFGMKETECLNWKRGLIVQGIEIRCIKNHAD